MQQKPRRRGPTRNDPRDIDTIIELLKDTRQILSVLVNETCPVIPGRHHARLLRVWESMQEHFRELESPSSYSKYAKKLYAHDLTGPALEFKAKVFDQHRDRVLDLGSQSIQDKHEKPWYKKWWQRAKPALKSSKVVLGSLGSIFPGAGAVKEFIEVLLVAGDTEMES